jgi:hypothetical protein
MVLYKESNFVQLSSRNLPVHHVKENIVWCKPIEKTVNTAFSQNIWQFFMQHLHIFIEFSVCIEKQSIKGTQLQWNRIDWNQEN